MVSLQPHHGTLATHRIAPGVHTTAGGLWLWVWPPGGGPECLLMTMLAMLLPGGGSVLRAEGCFGVQNHEVATRFYASW